MVPWFKAVYPLRTKDREGEVSIINIVKHEDVSDFAVIITLMLDSGWGNH